LINFEKENIFFIFNMLKLFSALVLITSLVKSDYSDDDHTVQLNNLGAKQLG